MSFLHWFSAKKKPEAAPTEMPSSGLSRMDSTRPAHAARPAGSAQPANRKQERMARRELLYGVVREAMVRAGVLSSSYKFKVLSLDARGRQFLVMMDLAQGAAADMVRLAEIEAMVAQSAKSKHDILVTAVYWRGNEHVAVGDPAARAQAKAAEPAAAAVVVAPVAPVAVVAPAVAAVAAAPAAPRIEALHPTEVAAFQRVLASSLKGEQALASVKGNPQSYTLLTGFEDTELAEGGVPPEVLSGTQYGELR
jgi:hypothetical protein